MRWFENSYRRHLADMHIEDWNEEFLRDFSPEVYLENLRRAKIQTPMIYLQSHVGYSNHPTRSGRVHGAMKGDKSPIMRLIDLCHADGMSVVGYYSLIYNTWAHDQHPEWRMVDASGRSLRERIPHYRYGLCCPNNKEYRRFVFEQIDEIFSLFQLEGIFYDMLFWPDVCMCPSCRERFRREEGAEIPETADFSDPVWMKFMTARERWMGEFAQTVTDYTKKLDPKVTVEHNYASSISADNWLSGTSERISEACEFACGDLFGDPYNHSFACKYFMNCTKNAPFEYMTGRCTGSLARHTLTRSERDMSLEVLLTAAHHGASLMIDALDPRGTMDERVYDRIGKVFARQIPYEPYFSKGKHLEEIGVFYSASGRYNLNGDAIHSRTGAKGAVRTLIRRHLPVGVLTNAMKQPLEEYKVILLPAVAGLFPEARAGILEYVKNGGSVYLSGNGEPELLKEFFDGTITGITRENRTYVAPTDQGKEFFSEFTPAFPMPAECHLAYLKATQGECLATITLPYTSREEDKFASIHSDPPGIPTEAPAVLFNLYGKGKVLWSAAPLEAFDGWQYEEILMNFIELLGGKDWTVSSDASEGVEIIPFRTEKGFLLSIVDLFSEREDLHKGPISITLRTSGNGKVVLCPSGEELPCEYDADQGLLRVTLPVLSQFAMLEIFIEKPGKP